MKEHPILFSGPMVRALLNGSKNQTRRVVKMKSHYQIEERDDGTLWPWMYDADRDADSWMACPYGQNGERLWVRETWAAHWMYEDVPPVLARSEHDSLRPGDNRWFAADGDNGASQLGTLPDGLRGRWRPSIHMPRWASRITLEITGVRVERLQDISEADAIGEGVTKNRCDCKFGIPGAFGEMETVPFSSLTDQSMGVVYQPKPTKPWAISAYQELWESINGSESWSANPWVWVVDFERV